MERDLFVQSFHTKCFGPRPEPPRTCNQLSSAQNAGHVEGFGSLRQLLAQELGNEEAKEMRHLDRQSDTKLFLAAFWGASELDQERFFFAVTCDTLTGIPQHSKYLEIHTWFLCLMKEGLPIVWLANNSFAGVDH